MTSEHDDGQDTGFLSGGGEMGERIRAFDWSAHRLGAPSNWPQALKTAVRLMLTTQHPVEVLWGPDLLIFYNDAFARSLGPEKHPGMLGQRAPEIWAEAWSIVGPEVESVLEGRGSVWREDQLVPITRNGRLDEVYWTYSYSPIDHEGGVGGVLVICTETTANVLEARNRVTERQRQQRLFEQAPGFIVIMRGPEHVVEFVNDAHRRVFNSGDWLGYTIREAFPSIAGQGFYEILDEVYRSGKAFEAHATPVEFKRGRAYAPELHYLTFIYAPLYDDDGTISGIFCEGFDVTPVQLAERRTRALAELGDLIRRVEDADELAYSAAELLGRELKVGRAGYGTIDVANETIRIERDWNAPGIVSLAGLLHFRDYGSYIEELKRGETVVVSDARDDPRTAGTASALEAISARSFVNMPVTEQGGFVALLYLNHHEPRVWTDEEIALIREVAERTRTAVERRRVEAVVRDNESRLRFLDDLARETASATDADAILGITTHLLGEQLGVDVCAYADMEEDEDHFTIRGDWARPGHQSIKGYYSLAAFGRKAVSNLHANRPLVINDNLAELAPEEAKSFRDIGIAATICMPFVKEGKLTALMAIHSATPRAWTKRELALLSEVTERSWAHIERVRSEAAVRLSEGQFRTFAQVVPNHLWTGRPDGLLDWFNNRVYEYTGKGLDELQGQGWATILHPDDLPAAAAGWIGAVQAGRDHQAEFRIRRHDGEFRWHLSRAVPMRDSAGNVVRWIGTNTDVHDQKNAETLLEQRLAERTAALEEAGEHLRQAQKMEAIGNLTGGVAHDFNNLLMAVLGSLELLRKRLPDDPSLLRLVDNASEGARRGSALTRRMLAFARRQELKSERIDAARLVSDMTELLQRTLGPMIAVETHFAPLLPMIETDPNQLESAILNLAVNARDAMQDSGSITISGSEATIYSSDGPLSAGRYVCIAVTDTGEGMDEATLARATEPFFTTKGVGKGTGLGLSMVHGLAEQSGGTLILKSAPGAGTTAEIWLPAIEDADVEQTNSEAAVPVSAAIDPHALTILAVDDDALVLMNTSALLEDLGHTVTEAHSGRQALEALQQQHYDLVVTDHAMPQMTGAQLASEIRQRWPGTPVLLATGYAELPPGAEIGLPRLSKPFSQRDLANAVAAVLGRAEA